MAYHIIFSERMWCYFLWIVHILGLPSWVFGTNGTLWHHDTMQHHDILMHLHWGAPQWHPTVGWAGLLDWLWRMHACPNVSHGAVAGAHAWSKSFLRREADGVRCNQKGRIAQLVMEGTCSLQWLLCRAVSGTHAQGCWWSTPLTGGQECMHAPMTSQWKSHLSGSEHLSWHYGSLCPWYETVHTLWKL